MRSDTMKDRTAMISSGLALALAILTGSPALSGGIDQVANNLKTSCSNHFRKQPNRPSNDSRKFCACFADVFTSTISLRELDAADGVVTPEIQEKFEHAADVCSYDISPAVAQSGREWIFETD